MLYSCMAWVIVIVVTVLSRSEPKGVTTPAGGIVSVVQPCLQLHVRTVPRQALTAAAAVQQDLGSCMHINALIGWCGLNTLDSSKTARMLVSFQEYQRAQKSP